MERITYNTHPNNTFLFAIARIFERASFYGLRTLIVVYMVRETIEFDSSKAYEIYGWFVSSLIFSKIIGALLGDLVLGNKKTILIGGILQTLGAFSLCLPTETGLYTGLALITLGSGLYDSNLIANYCKSYFGNKKLLDAGFMFLYLSVNIGSFLGPFILSFVRSKFNFSYAFILAGVFMLISLIPILFTKEKNIEYIPTIQNRDKRILILISVISIVALFWAGYELGLKYFLNLKLNISNLSTFIPNEYSVIYLSALFIIPLTIIALFVWSYYYFSNSLKLMLGAIFALLSFTILYYTPEAATNQDIGSYLIAILFLSISEVFFSPVIYTILTKYVNPKYLAIAISLALIPTKMASVFINGLRLEDNNMLSLKLALLIMGILSIGLIVYYFTNKNSQKI